MAYSFKNSTTSTASTWYYTSESTLTNANTNTALFTVIGLASSLTSGKEEAVKNLITLTSETTGANTTVTITNIGADAASTTDIVFTAVSATQVHSTFTFNKALGENQTLWTIQTDAGQTYAYFGTVNDTFTFKPDGTADKTLTFTPTFNEVTSATAVFGGFKSDVTLSTGVAVSGKTISIKGAAFDNNGVSLTRISKSYTIAFDADVEADKTFNITNANTENVSVTGNTNTNIFTVTRNIGANAIVSVEGGGGSKGDIFTAGGTTGITNSGTLVFSGTAAADTFTLTNVTASGDGKAKLFGGAGDDIFNINSSTSVSIVGGDGKDTFNFANLTGAVTASISGFDTTDSLNFGANVTGKIDASTTTVITFTSGNNTVTLNLDKEVNALYGASVKAGTEVTTIGELVDPYIWSNTTKGLAYGRTFAVKDNNALFSVTGLAGSVFTGTNVTASELQNVAISGTNVSITSHDAFGYNNFGYSTVKLTGTSDYKLAIKTEDGASTASVANTWKLGDKADSTTAVLYADGHVLFRANDAGTSITADYSTAEVGVGLSGILSNTTIGDTDGLSGTGKAVTVGKNAIGTGAITIESGTGYTITFGSTTSVVVNAAGTSVVGSNYADTFSLGENGLKASTGIISINGGAGDDVFDIGNIQGSLTLEGGGGNDTFKLTSGTAITLISESSDEDVFSFTPAGDITASVQGLTKGDSMTFGAEVTAGSVSGTKLTFTTSDVTVTLNLSDISNASDVYKVAVSNNGTLTNIGDIVDPYVWSVDGDNFKFARGTLTSDVLFTISGLNATATDTVKANITVDRAHSTVTITNASILNKSDVTLNDAPDGYKFALGNGVTSNTYTADWIVEGTSATYRAQGTVTYEVPTSSQTTIVATPPAPSVELTGIKAGATSSTFEVPSTTTITVPTGAIDSGTAITIEKSAGYSLTFGSAATVIVADSNTTVTGANEANAFSLSDTALTAETGTISIKGGTGVDTFTIDAKSGAGNLVLNGGGGADTFTLASGTAITLISEDTDTDTFIFNGAVTAEVTGLDKSDVISLSSAVDSGTFAGGVLTLGDVKLTLSEISDDNASDLYGTKVYNGTNGETVIEDLIDKKHWIADGEGAFSYGRTYGSDKNLISIAGGLNSTATTDALNAATSDGTLTLSANMLGTSDVSYTVATNYAVSVSADTTNTFAAGWVYDNSSATYKVDGTVSYTNDTANHVIKANDDRESAVELTGLASSTLVTNADKVVTVAEGAIGNDTITIAKGASYTINFASTAEHDANVLINDSNTTVTGAAGADSFTVSSVTNVSISGGDGADIFAISNGSDFTLNGEAGDDVFNISGGSSIVADGGAGSDTFNISANITNLTLSGGDGKDTFAFADSITATITDLANADAISLSSAVTSGTFKAGVLTLDNVTLNLNNIKTDDASGLYGMTVNNGGTETVIEELIDTIGWTFDSATGVATYGRSYGDEKGMVTISGLTLKGVTEITDSLIKISSETTTEGTTNYTFSLADSIITESATEDKAVTIKYSSTDDTYNSSNTKLARINSDTNVYTHTAAKWELGSSNTQLVYTSYEDIAGYTVETDGQSIYYDPTSHTTTSFTVSGLIEMTAANINSATGLTDSTGATLVGIEFDSTLTADTGKVLIAEGALNKTDITIESTSGTTKHYSVTLAGGDIVPETTPAAWQGTTEKGTFNYHTADVTEGYANDTEDDGDAYIRYIEPIASENAATITGMSTVTTANDLDSATSGEFITLNRELLAGTEGVILTSDSYHLQLDTDTTPTIISASWAATGNGVVTYTALESGDGYTLTTGTNTETISVVDASGGDIISISGLNDTATLNANDIVSGITYDDTLNTFTIAARLLNEENVTLSADHKHGAITNYKLATGSDVVAPTTREKYWITAAHDDNETLRTATYYAGTGTVAGYSFDSNTNATLITYVPEQNTDKAIIVDGLKRTAIDKNNTVSGLNLDETTLKIAANLIATDGATVEGTGYQYLLSGKGKLYSTGEGELTLTGSASNDTLSNIGEATVTIDGGKGNDVISAGDNNSSVTGGAGNDTITLGNGNDTVVYQSGKDVINNFDADNDVITLGGTTTTIKSVAFDGTDLTLSIGAGSVKFTSVQGQEIAVGDSIYSDNYIYNSDKTAMALASTFADTVLTVDSTSAVKTIDASNAKVGVELTVENTIAHTITGSKKNDTITGDAGNDSINGGNGNDIIDGGLGRDTLTGGAGNDTFIYSEGSKYITDYEQNKDKISLVGADASDEVTITDAASLNSSDLVLKLSTKDSITVGGGWNSNNGTSKTISVNGEKLTFGNHILYNGKKTGETLTSAYTGGTITADTDTSMVTIDGSAVTKALNITGNTKANVISGGSGADTLNGGAGNDTLTGGAGKDIFTYQVGQGKDVITDYTPGTDTLLITNSNSSSSIKGFAAITNAVYSDDGEGNLDLILTVNKQAITLKAASVLEDNAIRIGSSTSDTAGYYFEDNLAYNNTKTVAKIYSAYKEGLDATDISSIVTIDGSAAVNALKLTGNTKGNLITGGKKADTLNGGAGNDTLNGNAGNDSIYGGAGNDTLTGGDGKDTFVFEANEGNDVITDYTAGKDKLQINSDFSVSVSGSNAVFTIGTGKVTLTGASSANITVTDKDNKTATKSASDWAEYTASTSADMFDLLEDNNFMTDIPEIDDVSAITDNKYSVGDVKKDNLDSLTQSQDLITYGDDDKK